MLYGLCELGYSFIAGGVKRIKREFSLLILVCVMRQRWGMYARWLLSVPIFTEGRKGKVMGNSIPWHMAHALIDRVDPNYPTRAARAQSARS
jgi:hypothetical protein